MITVRLVTCFYHGNVSENSKIILFLIKALCSITQLNMHLCALEMLNIVRAPYKFCRLI